MSINLSPDVLVIGGGIAGIAAAYAAAETRDITVTLIEKNEYLGGKATAAFVGTICGSFFNGLAGNMNLIADGFPAFFINNLAVKSFTKPVYHSSGLWFLPYDRDVFISFCQNLLIKKNIQILFGFTISGAEVESENITSIRVIGSGKELILNPKSVIDASGMALSSEITGQMPIQSDSYQAAAHIFEWHGLPDWDEFGISLTFTKRLRQGMELGIFKKSMVQLYMVPGTLHKNKALFKLGIPIPITNDPKSIIDANQYALYTIQSVYNYLKSEIPELSKSYLGFVAPETGIRTGPRNLGKYLLSENDVLSGRKWSEGIARGAWPIEQWIPGKNPDFKFLPDNAYYEIPADCLIASTIKNVFYCGRNISADDMAIASARVMGICIQTGYAAGILASTVALGGSLKQSIGQIQQCMFHSN